MGWKNCTACGRNYKEGRQGCTNSACRLFHQGDAAQGGGGASAKTTENASVVDSPAVRRPAPPPITKVEIPEPVNPLRVSPPPIVVTPVAVSSTHVLPVIQSPSEDTQAREGGSIDIRQQLLDLQGGSVASLVLDGKLSELGKGVNKQVYRVKDAPWVVAVTTQGAQGSKWRAVASEITQLLALAASGVTVPSLGPVASADNALIDVIAADGQPAKAFIEQLIVGKHNLCRQESHEYADKFAGEIERVIGGRHSFDLARWRNAKDDLDRLQAYFAKGTDIPDFQIVVEESTGHIYTIDPGDPNATGSVLSKHVQWLNTWQKVITALEPRKR